MPNKQYRIGEVLYIISEASQKIIPVQVHEIHKKTTIEGEEVIFMVQDPNESGPYNLDDIDGTVFKNANDASSYLKKAANAAIDKMVNKAVSMAKNKFKIQEKSPFVQAAQRNVEEDIKKEETKISSQQPEEDEPKKIASKEVKTDGDKIEIADAHGNPKQYKIGKITMPDFEKANSH